MGRAVNALMGKSRAENNSGQNYQTKSPRDGGNKSRQTEIKKRFGFLRNVFIIPPE